MPFICILRQMITFFKGVLCYFSHFSNDFCVILFLHVKISIPITTEHITILIHWDVDSPISIPRSLSSYRANSSANLKTAYKTRYSCRLFAFLPFLRHISPYIHSTAVIKRFPAASTACTGKSGTHVGAAIDSV